MTYPTDLDTNLPAFTAQGTINLATNDHALDHRTLGTAALQIETKLGVGAGSPTLGAFLQGSGNGTSVWSTSLDNKTIGTPSITGGTYASGVFTGGTYNNPVISAGSAVSGLSLLNNGSITNTGTADHITLTPGASKLVRVAAITNTSGTSAYTNNIVFLRGWNRSGPTGGGGGDTGSSGSVSYGVTLTSPAFPVVSIGPSGTSATIDPTSGNVDNYKTTINVITATTTGFSYTIALGDGGTLGANKYYVTNWQAIGVL